MPLEHSYSEHMHICATNYTNPLFPLYSILGYVLWLERRHKHTHTCTDNSSMVYSEETYDVWTYIMQINRENTSQCLKWINSFLSIFMCASHQLQHAITSVVWAPQLLPQSSHECNLKKPACPFHILDAMLEMAHYCLKECGPTSIPKPQSEVWTWVLENWHDI